MLIIRLQRVGRKNDPSFRVVVTESTNSTKSGKFLEILGSYNPRHTAAKTILNAERIQHWISQGAKLSDTMNNLLVSKKIITGEAVNNISKKLGKKAQKTRNDAEQTRKNADKTRTDAEGISTKEELPEVAVTEDIPVEEIAVEPEAVAPEVTIATKI